MDFITTIGGIGQHVAEYNYNHRDELIEKNLHANEAPNYPGGPLVWSWLQSIDYSYNTQGWLTGINNWNPSATINTPALCTPAMPNPASPARSTYNEASDLFMLDLRYDQPATGISGLTAAPAQKAGNISQIVYRVRGRESSIISYSYDYLSRLSTSTFHNYSDAGVISGTNNYNENLTYDLRGNIQTLQRTGFYQNGGTCTYGQIDNLSYSYSPNTNRLHKVLDGTTTAGDAKSRGFNGNLSTADNSMTYDRNGNLNKNLHKNVSTITYNHLNLPTVITFTTGNTIEFLYDAAGMKLRKTVKVGATVQYVQDYLSGGVEYRQNGTGVKRVESVFHTEGRYYNTNVDASNTISWRREYNIKDHLGNTRLVFTDRNANGVVDITGTASTSDVLQENHYYAFGLPFEGAWLQNDAAARDNKYQYNGKEFNDDYGLNWNDYGARWYDASVGRWNAVDPASTDYFNLSSFHFSGNNPIVNRDVDGKRFYFAPGAGGDQDGWNYTSRWQQSATRNGIGGFVPINVTRGPNLDIEFTTLNRMSPFDEYVTEGYGGFRYHSTIDRRERLVPPTVDKAVKLIEEDLVNSPLQEGEQVNLAGYSYGSVLFAHTALQLADKGVTIDNLILVGSPIPDNSKLYKTLTSHKNIKNVIRYDIGGDLLSNPQSIKDYIFGAKQNSNPDTGPHFDLARPDQKTDRNLQVIMEWLRLQGVK